MDSQCANQTALEAFKQDLQRFVVLLAAGTITEDRALSDVEKVTRIRALLATRETRRFYIRESGKANARAVSSTI